MAQTKRFNVKMTSKFSDNGSNNPNVRTRTSAPVRKSPGTSHDANHNGSSMGRTNISITRPIDVPDLEENEDSFFLPQSSSTGTTKSIIEELADAEPHRDSSKYRKSSNLSDYRYPLIILVTIYASVYFFKNHIHPLLMKQKVESDFAMAKKDSMNFFNDIPSDDWKLAKQRVRERQNHLNPNDPDLWINSPHAWYQNNWEPDFTCQHERRVGGMGDGPKWVCDPHRIPRVVKERVAKGGSGCLVYSVGSANNYEFELGLQREVGKDTCEIHIFDIVPNEGEIPDGMNYHVWGLETSEELTMGPPFKSFQEIVASLGHQGRTIDIFKVDCEGCEWRTFNDWFTSGVDIVQILVEVHFSPANANTFFSTMQEQGFVTFHKEPNIIFGGGNCQEYALIKLAPSFYD